MIIKQNCIVCIEEITSNLKFKNKLNITKILNRGYSTDWYNKIQGHILKRPMIKLKKIFNNKKSYF